MLKRNQKTAFVFGEKISQQLKITEKNEMKPAREQTKTEEEAIVAYLSSSETLNLHSNTVNFICSRNLCSEDALNSF